ncbi:MAG TPA: DNA alkylation repair protein [Anaerolineae bacterium]|nr:DNA alkylation repair protein [Anaerolineae bacterium]
MARYANDPEAVADRYLQDYEALPNRRAATVWPLRRAFARSLRDADPAFVLAMARALFRKRANPGHATCLLMLHKQTFAILGEKEIEEFGQGFDTWGKVDSFYRWLAGPAWLKGQIPDALIHRWARSGDRWWRRAALVSTIALNVRSHGGYGDTKRTLAVCEILADDPDDMVYKALSWALRELVVHDPDAVRGFLEKHDRVLAARVKREVNNKLATGLKNPRRT